MTKKNVRTREQYLLNLRRSKKNLKGIFRSEEEWNRRSTLRFAFHRINPNNRAERTRGAAFKIENSATECLQTGGPRRSSPTFYEEIVPGDDEQLVETCYHRDFQLPPLPTVSLILYLVNFRLSLPTFSPPPSSLHTKMFDSLSVTIEQSFFDKSRTKTTRFVFFV